MQKTDTDENMIMTQWYVVFEAFSFNTEALCYAIKDTKTLKAYMSVAHIRNAIKSFQINQFEEALSILMNMDKKTAREYVKKYPDRIDLVDLEIMAERLLEAIQKDKNLDSATIKSLAHSVSPIGLILDILLSKLVAEKKYKEVV